MSNELKAVIVAAGEAKRLRPLTNDTPKCFLPVNDKPLIEYSLKALKQNGIHQVGFVVGYLKDKFSEILGSQYTYIFNPFYAITNDMASLWFAKHFIGDSDFIYCHSDLLYHPDILAMTVQSDAEITLAVEKTDCDDEMMKVKVDDGYLVESSKAIPKSEAIGEWTGIAKFTNTGWKKCLAEIEQLLSEGDFNVYDTKAMNRLAKKEKIIKIVDFQNLPFVEIDFIEDLQKAKRETINLIA